MPLPAGIRIRVARRGDRDAIYNLLSEVGVRIPPPDQSNTLSWIVSHPESEILLAVDSLDRAVGLLSFSHRPELRVGGRIGTIDELVVASSMRRKGIAGALVEKAQARARMLGCKRVEIPVRDAAARDFLRRREFTTSGFELMGWNNPSG